MATVTGFTAARMLEIENTTVVDGHIDGDDLILVQRDLTEINAGSVRGPIGPTGQADVGDIKANIRTSIPGWLNMDTPVANADTEHPLLWAEVPASWKYGTTLVFPDPDSLILQGGGTIGDVTGANTKTLVEANLPPHVHSGPTHTHAMGAHTHPIDHNHAAQTTADAAIPQLIGEFTEVNPLGDTGGGWVARRAVDAGSAAFITESGGGIHSHTYDVAAFSGNSGAATASNTGNNTAGNTGLGNGTSTPVNVEQRALRVNFFIFPG